MKSSLLLPIFESLFLKMKLNLIFILIVGSIQLTAQTSTLSQFFDNADSFFQSYVKNKGVEYEKVVEKPEKLKELIAFIEKYDYSKNEAEEKAYLINVYNLFVIHQVVENWPLASPQQLSGFFQADNFTLGGKKISLNALENELLRPVYEDPRFHFVLVCAGRGCPPIVNFAYRPESLNAQLEQQTKLALNDNGFIRQSEDEKTVYLSQIFSWYTSDFGKNNKEVIQYINTYRNQKFEEKYKVKYIPYNWSLNDANATNTSIQSSSSSTVTSPNLSGGQTFNAGSLLARGQSDITLFNTVYTQTGGDWQGANFSGPRETFVTHLVQYTLGTSKNKRFNLGFDLNIRSNGKETDSTAQGIGAGFTYSNSPTSRAGLTSVGLRLKMQPFATENNFSIQSTVMTPTVKNPEPTSDLYWADWNRITWWNQFFYTHSFGNFQLFTEFDMLFRFRRNSTQYGMLDMPMSAFLSYFPNNKMTFYVVSQHVPRLTNNIDQISTDWVIPMNYTASGVGFKYQFNSRFNIELLYSNFWRGKNTGLGETFNIGLKYITF